MKTKFSEYLEGLSSGGKVLETGQNFVVHLAKSREKMAVFQTEEPAYCFLKWYQAAVAGGARDVFFEMEKDSYVMILPFPEEIELGEICKAYEGEQAELCRRDRLLLEGLLASTSAEMETSISTDKESHVLSAMGLKKPGWWSRLGSFHKVYKEKSVRIAMRVKYSPMARGKIIRTIQDRTRFGPIVPYFVLDPAGRTSIEEREVPLFPPSPRAPGWHSPYSRTPNLLEAWKGEGGSLFRQRSLKRARPVASRYPKSLLVKPRDRGDVAILFDLQLAGQGYAVPVQEGVTLEPMRLELGCPGTTVAFSADGLKTDLSGFKLAENEELESRVEELRGVVRETASENADGVQSLQARKTYGMNPAGLLAGSATGFLYGLGVAPDDVLFCIVIAGCLGWLVEQAVRHKEFRQARADRSRAFREEVLKRLRPAAESD